MDTCAVLEPSHKGNDLVPNTWKISVMSLRDFTGDFWLFIVSSSELVVKK